MKTKEEDKDLNYWKENCKDDYLHTPISVLRYITELESKVNNGVLDDVSVLLPTDEEITDWVCDEFKIDGLNFDEDVETQYGYLPEYFKSFAKWIISNER